MQSQRNSKKTAIKKNTFFRIAKHVFFSFWPLVLHRCITFSYCVQIEWFKLFWNHHLKLYKSSCNSKGNRIIFKDFFEGFENKLWADQLRIFFKNEPLLLWGAVTFSPLIKFFQFLVWQMHQEKSSIYSLDTINNGALLRKQRANPKP